MPVCKLLQHKEAINNTKQFLVDTGGLKSMQSTEIADVALLRQGLKKLESLSIKSYGIPGRPWLEDSNGTNVYPNGKVLAAIDRVRRARGLYEDKLAVGAKLSEVVKLKQDQATVVLESQFASDFLGSQQNIENLEVSDVFYDLNLNGRKFKSEELIDKENEIILDESKDFVNNITDLTVEIRGNRDTEVTLIIKPLALELNKLELVNSFIKDNADIIEQEEIYVDSYKISQHYKQFKDESFFSDLVEYYTGKKVIVYRLKVNKELIPEIRKKIGHSSDFITNKTSLRYQLVGDKFFEIKDKFGVIDNGIHFSDSKEEGKREVSIWFGIPKIFTDNINAIKAHKYLWTQLRKVNKSVTFSGGTLDGTEIESKPTDLDYRIITDNLEETLDKIQELIPESFLDKTGIDESSGKTYYKLEYNFEGGKADIAIVPKEGYLGRVSGNHLAVLMSDFWKRKVSAEKEKYYQLYQSAKSAYGEKSEKALKAKNNYEAIKDKFRKQVYEWFGTSKITRTLEDQYKVSEIGNKEFNEFLDTLSEVFPQDVVKIVKSPLKSKESVELKAKLKLRGRIYKAKDIVRGTLIINNALKKDSLEYIFSLLKSKFPHFKVEDYFKYPKLGYKGLNIDILTNDDGVIELQINTPTMIYLKETKEVSKNILGEELFKLIDEKYNGNGGKGHEIYDLLKEVKLAKNVELIKKLEQLSIDYYGKNFSNVEETFNSIKEELTQIRSVDTNKLNQIQQIFEDNPELSQVGTMEQYAAYLDTIFPDSRVKDIVYHGTDATFEKFMKLYNNIHFGTLKAAKERLATIKNQRKSSNENIYPVILDIKRPIITDADFDWELSTAGEQPDPYELIRTVGSLDNWLYENGYLPKEESDFFELPDKSIPENVALWQNYDSYVYKNFVEDKGSLSYSVLEPEQIHILGSKQDIEGFKNWIKSKEKQKLSRISAKPSDRIVGTEIAIDTTMKERLFGGKEVTSTADILSRIPKDHPLKPLANKLAKLSPVASVRYVAVAPLGETALAYYVPKTNEIVMYGNVLYDKGDSTATFLHEVIHGLTYKALRDPLNQDLIDEFDRLRKEAQDKLGTRNSYFTESLDEFITGVFTKSTFIKDLMETESTQPTKFKNLWEEIWHHILSIFKIGKKSSLYDQAFAVATNILETRNRNWEGIEEPVESIFAAESAIQSPAPRLITDEYGNTWYEVAVDQARDTSPIQLQIPSVEVKETSLTSEIREKLLEFAKKAGIKIEVLGNLLATRGANGLADIKNMLIQLQQGKEDFALAEEVAHFFVEGLDPNSQMYQEMMALAPYTRLYQVVASEYAEAYRRDKEMLKKETMGKLISLYLTDKQQFEYWVAPAGTSLFRKVVEWIRSFLKLTNKNKKYKSFIRAAEQILDVNTDGLNWNSQTELVFFNKVPSRSFVTLDGKQLPEDKKTLINLNDTIFDYKGFTFGSADNLERKKNLANNNDDLNTYYNSVELTPFGRELVDKIAAGLINVDNLEFYTSLTITDALKNRLSTIIGKSPTIHKSESLDVSQNIDGQTIIIQTTTKQFLENYAKENSDVFIIDNRAGVTEPNNPNFHKYNSGIKYTPEAQRARIDNIRKDRERAARQFETLGNGVISNFIIQAHIKLFSGGGLKRAIEYMENALNKISNDEVINLFKDSQGRIVIPLDNASRARDLIQKADKTLEAIIQFVGTLEGIASFYDIILENAKKIDADNITDEQVDALIFEMNKVANISEYWLSYTEEILEELRAKSGVEEATRVVSRVKTAIEQAQNEILKKSRDVVAKKLEKQIEGYNYGIVARIKDIERMIADRKTSKGTALSDKDIEALEKEKTDLETKHKMSAEKIINILTGREKDITAITTWIKTLPNTGDPVIASVGKLLRVVEQETQMTTLVQTQKFAQEMQDLMKKYNLSQDDIEEFLLTQETYRLYNPETETFENKQRMAFLNPFKDRHEFVEKMQAVNEARKAWYDSIKTGEDPELKEEYFRRKTDFEKFKLEHWNQDYTEAYYQRYNAIKEEFGQEMFEKAMEKVSTIYDEISLIEDSIIDETVENEEKAYERIRDLRRELAFLKMTVNDDGTIKTAEDVQIAKLLQKKSEVDSEIFEYNIDHKKFQEAVLSLINSYDVEPELKSQIEQALTDKNYSKVQTLASSIDSRIVSWFELNTINKPGEKFYDQRNKITDKLNDLFIQLDKIVGREPSSTISELWREIFTLSRPYRDEDGNINASAIPRALQQKITDFNQQIEDYRQQAESDMSTLNLSETQKKDLAEVKKQIREQVQELRKIQKKEETTEYLEEFEKYANASPAFSSFRETAINDKQAAKDFVELYPNDSFSEWFLANHYVGTKKNFFEQEVVAAYYPSYIWTKVEPIDSTLVEVIPTIKYGKREIKQAYHTKKIDFVTWSPVTQRWLPKSSKYKNPKYEELMQRSRVKGSKEEGLFELLNKMTAFHLETQVNSVTKAKLEWFIPSVQKRALEGNIITNAYGKFIDRGNTFEEKEGNFEQSEKVAPTAKQRLKQFMSRISSYLESGYWQAPETVRFDERSGQYVEVKREIPVMYTGYMDPEDVSKDVLMSTVLFRESVNKANELRNNLPTINLLEKILANTPNQKNRAEAIKFIKENKFHGVNKQYEVGKGLDDFLRHMRKLYRIGSQSDLFGFFNTIKNSFQGRLQNYINAEFHGWSSGKAMRKAASYHKNNLWFFLGESEKPLDQRSKDWFLQAFINPGNFEKLLLYTQPGAMKKFSSDNFMFLSTATFEYAISVNALYAHLFHKELSRTSPSGEKEVKKLYDIITIKDNQPFIDPNEGWVDEIGRPIDSAYLIRMKTQLTSILEYTQGKTAEMTKLNTTTIGTAVLFFKSWLIPSLRRRFDIKRANYVLDRDVEGYWLTFARLSFLMLKNLKAYGESNWNTFTEEDKANYFTALREITVMLASTLIITLGFGFDPDDEDKYKKVKEMDFFSQTALLIAVQTKLETEGLSPVPFLKLEGGIIPPILSEAPKYFTNPVIGMPIIADTFKLIDNLTKLLSGEESAYYDRNMPQYNIERGESKAYHFFIKLAQLDDLLYTWENPEGRLEVLVGMAKR